MTNDDIAKKLALLPEGLEEENIKSWENVLRFWNMATSVPGNGWLMPMVRLIQSIFESNQHKLFRAGLQLYTLIISTKEEHGLDVGDHHIRIDVDRNNSAEVLYLNNTDESEKITCKHDEIISKLQPFLGRLWNETRDKKNA